MTPRPMTPRPVNSQAHGPASEPPAVPTLSRFNPAHLAPPSGFTHAVAATGGRLVFLAGQTALDGDGRIVAGGLPEQFERALANLLAALRATGGRPCHLARVTVYTTDVAAYRTHARELGAIWRRSAGRDYPALAVVGAVRLWDEEALVELDGIAVLP
ncbi:RidA family protein [Streptomyces gamaensis]|uniref:RidA family protein n=1 Tax=Streptomyces gamaensis TaxID=1763542 RepID=A0ABW0Z9G5_9ACTN